MVTNLSMCGNKVRYATRLQAEKALRTIWKTSLFSQRKKPCLTYTCPECKGFHLTSKGKRKRVAV